MHNKRFFDKILIGIIFISISLLSISAEKRDVKVGSFDLPPLIFKGEDGEIEGFFIDLLEEIAFQENWKLEYVHGSWNDGLEGIRNQSLDIVTSAAYTKERDEYIDYTTVPAFSSWTQVFARENLEVETILDLDNKKIAIMRGDNNGKNFKLLSEKFNIKPIFEEYDDFK